jgi:hypothetical protein
LQINVCQWSRGYHQIQGIHAMNNKIRAAFLILVALQGLHSTEEFIFKFYDVFPPMVALYRDTPQLARAAFIVFNLFLIVVGLICLFQWVWPGKRGARTIVWVWISVETFNFVAHSVWAVLIGGYNPGLVTGIWFVPVVVYLSCQLRRVATGIAA